MNKDRGIRGVPIWADSMATAAINAAEAGEKLRKALEQLNAPRPSRIKRLRKWITRMSYRIGRLFRKPRKSIYIKSKQLDRILIEYQRKYAATTMTREIPLDHPNPQRLIIAMRAILHQTGVS